MALTVDGYPYWSYYFGLDLGQSADFTALAVLEEPIWVGEDYHTRYDGLWRSEVGHGWISPAGLPAVYVDRVRAINLNVGRPAHPPLRLRHLKRSPLRTPYGEIITELRGLLMADAVGHLPTALVVDKTGVGAGVVDYMRDKGLRPTPVTIHGGNRVIWEPWHVGGGVRVPKRDLVSAVEVLLQNGRLEIAPELEHARLLKQELLNFKVKIDPKTAHDSYEHWREGDHDDLVLAVALAAWRREYHCAHLDHRIATTGVGQMT